jgi:hypothetical protein
MQGLLLDGGRQLERGICCSLTLPAALHERATSGVSRSDSRSDLALRPPAGVQRPNQQVEELVALFDAQTRRRVAAVRRAHGARTQRFGLLQRVRPGVVSLKNETESYIDVSRGAAFLTKSHSTWGMRLTAKHPVIAGATPNSHKLTHRNEHPWPVQPVLGACRAPRPTVMHQRAHHTRANRQLTLLWLCGTTCRRCGGRVRC